MCNALLKMANAVLLCDSIAGKTKSKQKQHSENDTKPEKNAKIHKMCYDKKKYFMTG